MNRLERLALDAVERLGPDVKTLDVIDYVVERRRFFLRPPIPAVWDALRALESRGEVRRLIVPGGPERGGRVDHVWSVAP
jgi:hypothetical protein